MIQQAQNTGDKQQSESVSEQQELLVATTLAHKDHVLNKLYWFLQTIDP